MLWKKMCYIGVPTLKLIQAARTKEIFTSRNRWIALEKGQHVSHVCGWNERKREEESQHEFTQRWLERKI